MAVGHSVELEPLEAIAVAVEHCRASLGDASPQAALLLSAFDSFDPAVVASIRMEAVTRIATRPQACLHRRLPVTRSPNREIAAR